jgi:hypothetical protein
VTWCLAPQERPKRTHAGSLIKSGQVPQRGVWQSIAWGFKGEVTDCQTRSKFKGIGMFCRKCGRKKTTKRAAGIFHCLRCGMQPGALQMDRAGNPNPREKPEPKEDAMQDYIFAEPKRRPIAAWKGGAE